MDGLLQRKNEILCWISSHSSWNKTLKDI